MLWCMPVDTHVLRIDRWPIPDNQRSTSGSFASAPITIGPTSWVRRENDGRKGRKGRKPLAPIRRVEFVNDFNHRDGPVSATRRGRKVAESAGKSLQELCARNCPLFSCLTFGPRALACCQKLRTSRPPCWQCRRAYGLILQYRWARACPRRRLYGRASNPAPKSAPCSNHRSKRKSWTRSIAASTIRPRCWPTW